MTEVSKPRRDQIENDGGRNFISEAVSKLLGGDDKETERSQDLDYRSVTALPTDEDIVESSFDDLVTQKQLEEYEQNPENYSDASYVTVEIDVQEPHIPVQRVEERLVELHDELVEELNRLRSLEENTVSGADFNTLVHIISEQAGENGSITLVGGAETLLRKICNEESLSEDAKELVLLCHEEAAKRNGLKRHLIHDTVGFIPHEMRDWEDSL